MVKKILVGTAAVLVVAACGAPAHRVAVDDYDAGLYSAAVCVDQRGYRVPDDFCPIGDGIMNQGYGWDYYPYRDSVDVVVLPYVGYPVTGPGWTSTRPARVSTINIQRGVMPSSPPVGTNAMQAQVPTQAAIRKDAKAPVQRSSTITRGGLGVRPVKEETKVAAPAKTPTAPKGNRPSAPVSRKK